MAESNDGQAFLWRLQNWFPSLAGETNERLLTYRDELVKFNDKVNLVSPRTIAEADLIHFADPLLAWQCIEPELEKADRVYDIGSGNGVPGLVFAILDSKRGFVLVERDQRKAEFLRHMVAKLGLSHVEVFAKGVDKLDPGVVQWAVSRAFAPLKNALLTLGPYMAPGGLYFPLKGDEWAREVADLPSQLFAHWKATLTSNYEWPAQGRVMAILKAERK